MPDFRERVPASQWHEIAHEEFVRDPERHGRAILELLDLPLAEPFLDQVRSETDPSRSGRRREQLDPGLLEEVRPSLEPALGRLGYEG